MIPRLIRPRAGRLVLSALGYFGPASAVGAQSTSNQQKVDDLVRSAELFEMLGYILGGAGILLVIGGVVYSVYADRKKKARERVAQSEQPRRRKNPEEGTASRE